MTLQAGHSLGDGGTLGTSRPSLGARLGQLKEHLAAWIETCAAYYEAAALYDQLSGLSDAELHRRGLPRATLARDACGSSSSASSTRSS
jgi:hypothetical protein